MESIIVALITGGLALVGVIVTNIRSNNQNLDDKIADLTDEVRKHNAFSDRISKLEVRVAELEKRAS